MLVTPRLGRSADITDLTLLLLRADRLFKVAFVFDTQDLSRLLWSI